MASLFIMKSRQVVMPGRLKPGVMSKSALHSKFAAVGKKLTKRAQVAAEEILSYKLAAALQQIPEFTMGAQLGVQTSMPSDATFAKVAAATKIPEELLRAVYLAKCGGVLPGILGAGLLTYGGLKGIDALGNIASSGTLGGSAGSTNAYGGLSKAEYDRQAQLQKMILGTALRNYQSSELINQLRAAHPMSFRPM